MENIPLSWQLGLLFFLLSCTAFFSISETSLMSLNRYRMKHLAKQGHRGARLASVLLAKTDKLLGVILLGNTLCIVASSALEVRISEQIFGKGEYILMIGSLILTFAILVFSEISPKVIAAAHPERFAFACSYVLYPLLWLFNPVVSFVNFFVKGFLRLLGTKVNFEEANHAVSMEELKSIVTDAGHYIPKKHRAILLNLFDLEKITVDDVMTAHTLVETIDFDAPLEAIMQQIANSHHTRIPVRQGENEEIIGILQIRKVISHLRSLQSSLQSSHQANADLDSADFDKEALKEIISAPYFIPSGTPLYTQIQQFQEKQQRIGLVVDEYGDFKGLVTLEDILEEVIGDFTTQSPTKLGSFHQEEDGSWLVDGSSSLRDLNKKLGLTLPLDGPKTLNGLIIEHFEDIPEANTSFRINNHTLEIVQSQDRIVKSVKIFP